MKVATLKLLVATTAFAFTLAACSSDEVLPETHGRPSTVEALRYDDQHRTVAAVRTAERCDNAVDVHFYDADGDDISARWLRITSPRSRLRPAAFATSRRRR